LSFLKNIFSKNELANEPFDLSVLKCDVHSHLIPGIDDGVKTLHESIAILEGFKDLGYQKIITTPHVMSDFYRNSSSTILRGRDIVKEELLRKNIDLDFEVAAEYYLDEHFEELLAKKDLLTFGDNHVLFELSFHTEPMALNRVIFEMQTKGYHPVLAHPERYPYYNEDFEKYHSFVDKGVILQLNINSLSGGYSPMNKKVAKRLVEENMIELLGSDCHHSGHLNAIRMESSRSITLKTLLDSGKLINDKL
jgi:protein-tyrosine phosphatase